jgi:Ni,Fe-hydrogenase maturation factor
MGDDGVGCAIAERLSRHPRLPEWVEVVYDGSDLLRMTVRAYFRLLGISTASAGVGLGLSPTIQDRLAEIVETLLRQIECLTSGSAAAGSAFAP